jgi:hypothetical protein
MMFLAVYDQHYEDGKIVNNGPMLAAGVQGGALKVEGELPFPLSEYVTIEEVNTLKDSDAVKMFAVLSSSKYPGYSAVVMEGIDKDKVDQVMRREFNATQRAAIRGGINSKSVFRSL